MRTLFCGGAQLLWVALLLSSGLLASHVKAADRSDAPSAAVALVQQALRAELSGEDPAPLLTEALASDPECEQARWQLGYVQIDGQWIKIDDVPVATADDAKLTAYRQRRNALVDTADNQREMARWCTKQRLFQEARIHWAKLLEFEPQDAEALAALGLQWHDGKLMTRAQIVAARQQAAERLKDLRQWQPRVTKWRDALMGSNQEKTAAALAELDQLDDPAALGALEMVFGGAAIDTGNRLKLALVNVAGRMPTPAATAILVRQALAPNSQDVRLAACDKLKKRPMHTYVPQLIAAMPGKTSTKFALYLLPNGTVMHEHEVVFDGPEARMITSTESLFATPPTLGSANFSRQAFSAQLAQARAIERSAAAQEQANRQIRDRAAFALKQTTGFEKSDDPELWTRQYNDYYGWKKTSESKPEYHRYAWRTDAPTVPMLVSMQQGYSHPACFPPGTPVLTIRGPQPIETLQPGDRVLSQNPETGELAYKPVQKRTLRPGFKLMRIHLESGSISATFGHPFWVVGSGWRVAGRLEPGMRLRGLEGDRTVERVEEVPPSEVYNLIVVDFATYFAGQERLLVHDDSPLVDTAAVLPGLLAHAAGDTE